MKVEVEEVSPVQKRVNVELPAEQVADELEEQFKELQDKAQVPGFRKGKAPRKVLERRFGKYVLELTAEKLIKSSLTTALDRKAIKPVSEPVLDPAELKAGEAFAYTVHVEVKPEIALKDYKGLNVTHVERAVSDDDVELALKNLQESAAVIQAPADPRPAKVDDQVTGRVTVKAVGVDKPVVDGEEQEIELWRETWIPELANKLAGKSEGDEVSFEFAAPDEESVPAQFRGKQLEMSVTVIGVKERKIPALDDAFAKEYSRSETLAELKSSTREMLEERIQNMNLNSLQDAVVGELIKLNPVEAPPSLVKHESERMAREFIMQNSRRSPSPRDLESFSQLFMADAKRALASTYLLEAVAVAEKFEGSAEEVEAKVQEQAERVGMNADKLKDRLGESGLAMIKSQIEFEKALDFLVAQANIKEGAPKPEAETDESGK